MVRSGSPSLLPSTRMTSAPGQARVPISRTTLPLTVTLPSRIQASA